MAYMHIDNLYKDDTLVRLFRRLYAMEKVHGTSAHVAWSADAGVSFFSGGVKHEQFVALFDAEHLAGKFAGAGWPGKVTVYGEAYGGKCQGMAKTYGPGLRFIAFEVLLGDANERAQWLPVPQAEKAARALGLDFVPWREINATWAEVNYERDRDSELAVRNGMGVGHKREGIVLRPLAELMDTHGNRLIAKHKGDAFQERQHTPRTPAEIAVLSNAQDVAAEWVTPMRLVHVMDKQPDWWSVQHVPDVLKALWADISREAKGEIVDGRAVRVAIGKAGAKLFRQMLAKRAKEERRSDAELTS
jgi:hypothetical protein